ncbi:MAG: efflux RND transporter permease subunit [Aurantimicrobium sp.]
MIDPVLLRENPDVIRASQVARGSDPGLVDVALQADAERRAALAAFEELRAEQNVFSKKVGQAQGDEKKALLAEVAQLAAKVKEANAAATAADEAYTEAARKIQNPIIEGIPSGGEDNFVTLREVGTVPTFDFEPRDHLELGESLGAIDMTRGTKVSGARFYFLRGIGARLELALMNLALDRALEAGFVPLITPTLVRPDIMQGTGFLGEHSDEIYYLPADDLYLTGTSEVALAGYVAQAMRPTTIGTVVIEGTTLDIYIASNDPPTTEAELAALTVPTAKGLVPLDTLATVTVKDGPATVTTVKGQRSATVTVTPNSEDLGTATAEVTKALKDVDLPSGASAKIGGVSADQAAAFSSLGIALLVAILVVYIIMVATFGSLLQPLLLLISVPFAATGAIGLQVITGVPLGVPSFIGLLMLVGIVVTNAIVLIDLVNQYRNKGLAVSDALREGAIRRLRPILMTALATIFALIPMAVGITGSGGFISQPLAIVVIGGLISSTLLTLIVLPTIYNLVEGGREKRKAKRAEKKAAKAGTTASAPVSKEPVFDTLVVDDDGDDDTPIRRRTPSA